MTYSFYRRNIDQENLRYHVQSTTVAEPYQQSNVDNASISLNDLMMYNCYEEDFERHLPYYITKKCQS